MTKPEITVVIPVFNRQELILDTLKSLKSQSLKSWECIIVDDYSSDDSVKSIRSFVSLDSRFRIIEKSTEQKGAPSARNIGWRAAKTNYIVFLDSDDIMMSFCLENRLNWMKENNRLDFALFPVADYMGPQVAKLKYRSLVYTKDPLSSFLSFEATWQTASPVWQKKFLEEINGWDENTMSWQDGEVHIRALLKTKLFKWATDVPDVIIRFGNPNSISNSSSNKKLISLMDTHHRIYEKLPITKKQLFKQNFIIYTYNKIEQCEKNESELLVSNIAGYENPIFSTFDILKLKAYYYVYKLFKKTRLTNSLFYRIRMINNIFPKRVKYFTKNVMLPQNIEEEVRSNPNFHLIFRKQ